LTSKRANWFTKNLENAYYYYSCISLYAVKFSL